MMNRRQTIFAFGTIMVALLTALILLSSIQSRRRLLEETDTELDKAYFKGDHTMCCGNFRLLHPFSILCSKLTLIVHGIFSGMVPWPCCSHQACCEKFKEEGLDVPAT
jgi:hypothetical protein